MSFTISDGAHSAPGVNGNPEFFFLPPLTGDPSGNSNFDAGKFAWRLRPVVLVYALPTTAWDPGEGPDKCVFNTPAVYGPERGVVQPPVEQYAVNWNTPTDLLAGTYRVCVFSSSGGTLLGFLDVQPVQGGMKNAKSGDTYLFQDGRTLPVKFRIETGALCPPDYDTECLSATTKLSAGVADTIVLPSGHAALIIPAQTTPPPSGELTIEFSEELPQYDNLCLPPSLLLQSQGCYHASATSGGVAYTFDPAVTVEICVVPGDEFTAEQVARLRLFKYNPTDGVQQWPWVEPTLIDCSTYAPQQPAVGGLGGLLRGLGNLVQRIFAPQPLYAAKFGLPPTGVGGSDRTFSDFGGGLISSIGVNGGNNQTAPAGTPVPIPPSVIVRDTAGHPVSGVNVLFRALGNGTVTHGGVTADTTVVTTGQDGIASITTWTLGTDVQPDTLTASAYDFVGSPVFFYAMATAEPVGIGHFNMNITTLPIGGMAMPYEITLDNYTGGTLDNINLQGWISRNNDPNDLVDAGNTVLTCTGTPGALPTPSCVQSGTLAAASGLPLGTTTAHVQVRQGTTVLATTSFPVTLVTAMLPVEVTWPLAASVHFHDGDTANVYRLDPWATSWAEVTNGHSLLNDDRSPAWFQNGQALVFERDSNLYRINADGTGLVQLTSSNQDHYPAVSPLADSIIFVRGVGAARDIWIMASDGSAARNLTSRPADYLGRPYYSPDGSRIVFVASGAPYYLSAGDLYLINADGTNLQRLTYLNNAYADPRSPVWSPGGDLIAYSYSLEIAGRRIHVISRDGSGDHQITSGSTFDGSPAWSPDGHWIAFSRVPSYSDQQQPPTPPVDIFVIRPDGSDERKVSYGSYNAVEYSEPAWPLLYYRPALIPDQIVPLKDPITFNSSYCYDAIEQQMVGTGSLFQTFTPSVNSLPALDLYLYGTVPAEGYTTTIHIRDGAPTGTVIGSATAFVAYLGQTDVKTDVRFQFSPPLALVPSHTYVIEWVAPTGPPVNLGWVGYQDVSYAGGPSYGCYGAAGGPIPGDYVFTTWW